MPLSPPFSRFKPIVILALITMVIVTGSYAAQYYTWSVGYQIIPLSETKVVVDLGAHSGATSVPDVSVGSFASPVTYIWVPAGKMLDIYIMIPHSALDQLEAHFYSITLKIHLKDGIATTPSEQHFTFDLVIGGSHITPILTESVSGLEGRYVEIALATGTWNVWFEVTNIWTGAVAESTDSVSFPIYVYAVEV